MPKAILAFRPHDRVEQLAGEGSHARCMLVANRRVSHALPCSRLAAWAQIAPTTDELALPRASGRVPCRAWRVLSSQIGMTSRIERVLGEDQIRSKERLVRQLLDE